MPQPRRHTTTRALDPIFERIRRDNQVRDPFPAAVTAAAARTAATSPPNVAEAADRRDLELITIDPPGSKDLDQAVHVARRGSGYRFSYAIADVAAWVHPGDAIDVEARARGVTIYCPDRRVPLHPTELSEGSASLLADVDRPALLWTVDLDQRGEVADAHVERSIVRVRETLGYPDAQTRLDDGTATESLRLVEELGRLRVEREIDRGGISLQLPDQNVAAEGDGYVLHYEASLPIETWNAQMSLCCGMVGAQLMIDAGVGILRTLPAADDDAISELRRQAAAFDVAWPADVGYSAWVRGLRDDTPSGAALLASAARSFRGAGYLAFDGPLPSDHRHSAIASTYAHVTAPLRRLVDRFGSEFALAASEGRPASPWARQALETLPEVMGDTTRRASMVDRGVIDVMEAATMASHVGETFDAMVTSVGGQHARVQLRDPAVIASIGADSHGPGDEVRLVLRSVDIAGGKVELVSL